ncbi:hypothetical protein PPUJ20066_08700 [Pseudomonas putida]|nr:hypothetical protein PPUJ20066_08700 [Pseudomonas putida]
MGFTGQRYDDFTNCYLLGNGYRAYNPRLSRFLSADSLSPFTTRTHNAYAYCLGDPVNRHDPSGHMWKSIQEAWKHYKAKRDDPRPYHTRKAREAINEHPKLKKYTAIVDDPDTNIENLKKIYEIPKGKAVLKKYKAEAEENWLLKDEDLQPLIINENTPPNYLNDDDGEYYTTVMLLINEHKRTLNSLIHPNTASSVVRGS